VQTARALRGVDGTQLQSLFTSLYMYIHTHQNAACILRPHNYTNEWTACAEFTKDEKINDPASTITHI